MGRQRDTRRWTHVALAVAACAGLVPAAAVFRPAASAQAAARAASFAATDESQVPHYFGPYSNYANSSQAVTDAVVTVTGGGGTGAAATANVDAATGGITSIDVTTPGEGYTAPPTVEITSPGITPTAIASATATIATGALTSITVDGSGFGFTETAVTITDNSANPGSGATAVASGGVDNLVLVDGGSGYVDKPAVHIGLPDLPYGRQATGVANMSGGVVTSVSIVDGGSGYTKAPSVAIWDGVNSNNGGLPAQVTSTINVSQVDVTSAGLDYTTPPTVQILDTTAPFDRGAMATANIAAKGAVTGIHVDAPGAGYITPGIKKFIDTLPTSGPSGANNLGEYIPVAQPDTTTFPGTDYYEIAVVQYRHSFGSDIPASLIRGYVQLSTGVIPGKHVPLTNAPLDPAGTPAPVLLPDGSRAYGVDTPHYLGPTIMATKNRPVRVLFRNLLPTGSAGDLFLPVDTTVMGAGEGPNGMMLGANGVPMDMTTNQGTVTDGVRNPECGNSPKPGNCYTENRAELHLHGGITPWISDGTPHQWTTPAGEMTPYPKGVSVTNVPDMPDPGPGAENFFYTNQQSARLMFYHDHSWGITRLNVYAGEAAGYQITDETEQSLFGAAGKFSDLGMGTTLHIQDKTFVPNAAQLAKSDPTWNTARYGGEGNLWSPHVYMPAQNPSDPTGLNGFGRWHYGPWFWPPATGTKSGPIANPYFDPTCVPSNANGNFCEPQMIPGTPNNSVGMEAFNDTPVVNGVAYPTTTVDPKAYRFRVINDGGDRAWNLSWYRADPTTGTNSEVALDPASLAAAQTDPNVVPFPDTTKSPAGPSWVQIGSEGGFLPAPAIVAPQPTTWITDPTRFDVGNVKDHSLLLAPAERADVIVDFSQYACKTLILYNDAPAAFPARVSQYDYYTGDADQFPIAAHSTLPGYGPNTRTVMQVKVACKVPTAAFDKPNTTADRMGDLMAAFTHHLDANGKPAGVFETGQHPIIVGQAAYNAAYGSNFVNYGAYCSSPQSPTAKCDGFARIAQQVGQKFKFDTLSGNQVSVPIESKAIHDETNSNTFDEFGRSTAMLGTETPGASPLTQNINLFPYVNPSSEQMYSDGLPSSLNVTPISTGSDGTQIWKITHNGVDTHPIHFHLFDVQLINRVTWDGIIMPPEATELGWKDTLRISPLQDTIVAVRPIIPTLPFNIPNSKRVLNPMMPIGAVGDQTGPLGNQAGFNNTDSLGNPINPIVNQVVDMGWEYVWHCHILSHEEMDMMRPMSVHVTSAAPDASTLTLGKSSTDASQVILNWNDPTPVNYLDPTTWGSRKSEVGYRIERAALTTTGWGLYAPVGTALANATSFTDTIPSATTVYDYRVVAWNEGNETPSNDAQVYLGARVASTLTLASSGTATLGDKVTFTATVSNAAYGPVTFTIDGTDVVPSVTTVGGRATYSTTSLTRGVHTVVASFAGDLLNLPSTSNTISQTILGYPSTVSVASSLNPNIESQSVTFTATVKAVRPADGTPGGSVKYTIANPNGLPLTSTVPVSGAGTATFTTSSLLIGTNAVTADYQPSGLFESSTGSMTQTAKGRPTATTLTNNAPATVTYGATSVTWTARVTPTSPFTGVPTGTVSLTFTPATGTPVVVTGLPLTATTGVANSATATFSSSTVVLGGQYTVTATYVPTGVFATSVNSGVAFRVTSRPTSVTVLSSANPGVVTKAITFSAQVRAVAPATGTPTGSVVFTYTTPAGITTTSAPVTLDRNGNGSLAAITTLPLGVTSVTAAYTPTGTTGFEPSVSSQLSQTVALAATTTTVSSSAASVTYGVAPTLTATVASVVTANGTPTGSVVFTITNPGAASTVTNAITVTAGRATYSATGLSIGVHSVTAVFTPTASSAFNTSTATALSQTVTTATPTVALVRSPATGSISRATQKLTLTATMTGVTGGPTPTGTVTFREAGTAIAACTNVPLVNGAASCANYVRPTAGNNIAYSVVYNGDTTYRTATSGNTNVTWV
jgi:FtsP/CotA-like multicopper oxidase with cupredoxin domain